ncbi:MAG: ATP-binding protein [Xanthomonadales bacterium]|nr:ATP-binding protein [Xanthomonadales bacterium]
MESARLQTDSLAGHQTDNFGWADTLDLLDTAVLRLDEHHRVSVMNAAAEQALSLGRERLAGRHLADLLPLPDVLTEALKQLPAEDSSIRLHDVKLPGSNYDCILTAQAGGGVLVELHNLDWENRRSRLQQRELQTGLLELLARNLGHEIRNPLGGIRGAAQMLAAELETPELATLARMIMRESDRIDDLIQSLGQPQMAQQSVAIYPLLDEALGLLATEFTHDVRIDRDFDPSIPPILGDPSALRQVLLNLLRNAFEAHTTCIKLRTRIEHGGALLQTSNAALLRLDVMDDGDGVPEALRQLLFLPMVTGKRGGTGLGLALSQQIAAAHGGLLTYEPRDEHAGSGSCFSLYLPLVSSQTVEQVSASGNSGTDS